MQIAKLGLGLRKKRAGRIEKNTYYKIEEGLIYTIDAHNGPKVVTRAQL